ncbi:MAG TPA: sucrose phosphorylase [Vicinamibacterales bacterium]|nr:sucrose phosphorylase [Vicinamibacterales bacterium]
MTNQAQLIAYVDRLTGGTFRDLTPLLDGPLKDAFAGVHLLPFFHPIDGADAGFDPIDHTQVDRRLGTWADVKALTERTAVMADLIVNHVSRHSPPFQDFDRRGTDSPYAGMFLTFARVFPDGAQESDLRALYTIRPALPFTKHDTASGTSVVLWTTFTSDQIDLDVQHPEARRYLLAVLDRFQEAGIRMIRLDAVGHAVKEAGTSCFMIPQTFAFIAGLTAEARERGMEVLVEVHGHHLDQVAVAGQVDRVYDFALPPLVLHALYRRDAAPLKRWLDMRPHNAVTVLDTHDGIGVADVAERRRPSPAPGLLAAADIEALVETIHERSGGASRLASGSGAANVDASQINCTFYDALGRRDAEYLIARAVQCFVPGIPQIYYVGLLAGGNDLDLLRRTGAGRDINRHYYTPEEVRRELTRPVVRSLLELLRLRNAHPAFQGTFHLGTSAPHHLLLEWANGSDTARLDVDLAEMRAVVTLAGPCATRERAHAWSSTVEA